MMMLFRWPSLCLLLLLWMCDVVRGQEEGPAIHGNLRAVSPKTNITTRSLSNIVISPPPLTWEETRDTYVMYPPSASEVLLEELSVYKAALGLDVTTNLVLGEENFLLWQLLKGMVHRFRKQNQIIHVNPHYYVATGLELGCRQSITNEDTGALEEIEVQPIPHHCDGHCTNHGRYCLIPQAADGGGRTGQELIEEVLRRICFDQVYHASDLRFWEYMEALQTLPCEADAETCSEQALQQVSKTSFHAIQNCVHLAGGTQGDHENVHLEMEIDHRKGAHSQYYYTAADVPMLHVEGRRYTGTEWTVEAIFPFLCQVYHQTSGVQPVACQFCQRCQDIRKCLWKLECDGQPFDLTDEHNEEDDTNMPSPNVEDINAIASNTVNMNMTAMPEGLVVPEALPSSSSSEGTASLPPEAIVGNFVPAEGTVQLPPGMTPPPIVTPPADTTTYTEAPANAGNGTNYDDEYRKEQRKELEELYLRWLIAACVIVAIVLAVVGIRAYRKYRHQLLLEQYKKDTQARWRAREMEHMSDEYSVKWPIGLVPNDSKKNKNSRISRKNRRASVQDQQLNKDHSKQLDRSLASLFPSFGRNRTPEMIPSQQQPPRSPGFSRQVTAPAENLSSSGPRSLLPGFSRQRSLENTPLPGTYRGPSTYVSGRPRRASVQDMPRLSPAQVEALMDASAAENQMHRLSPAHAAALMEAAATSTPVPAQPMTTAPLSPRNTRRPKAPNSLEDMFKEDEEEEKAVASAASANQQQPEELDSESSRGSGSDPQLSYSTNWLTGYSSRGTGGRGRGAAAVDNPRDAMFDNDASAYDGLEDITTL